MEHILVVEDSPTQAEEIAWALRESGYTVEVRADGSAAWACMRYTWFDLVISDALMPDMNGFTLSQRIKSDPCRRATPVILLTELREKVDVLHALECGADTYLTKPVAAAELVEAVRRTLDSREARAANYDTRVHYLAPDFANRARSGAAK